MYDRHGTEQEMSDVGTYNLHINQFATFMRVFIWTAGMCGCGTVGATSGPADLTGYSANLQIRPFALSTTVLFDASADIVLGGVSGTITLTIPATSTAAFTWWNGVYDLLLTSAAGVVTRLLQGSVTVTPGVTP
jgi:hypothetical protein